MKPKFRSLRAFMLIGALAVAPHALAEPSPDRPLIDVPQVAPRPHGDILEVAAATGQFRTFLRAVQAAGYEDTLRGPGPFTVFAPTDDAFAHMDQRQLRRIMDPLHHDELLSMLEIGRAHV